MGDLGKAFDNAIKVLLGCLGVALLVIVALSWVAWTLWRRGAA